MPYSLILSLSLSLPLSLSLYCFVFVFVFFLISLFPLFIILYLVQSNTLLIVLPDLNEIVFYLSWSYRPFLYCIDQAGLGGIHSEEWA